MTLAEATTELGGRLLHESRLPGLSTWLRVRDWRVGQLQKMTNVEIYLDSRLEIDHLLEFGFPSVVIATGASWTTDLTDSRLVPVPASGSGPILTPDDLFAGAELSDPVVIFDFDQYVMGGCLAERLALAQHRVVFVTNGNEVSGWCQLTHDQWYAQKRLMELDVEIITGRYVTAYDGSTVTTACKYTGRESALEAASLVVVGVRRANDHLYRSLTSREDLTDAGIRSVQRIGDCEVPGAVVHAIYAGHKLAQEFDEVADQEVSFRMEQAVLEDLHAQGI